MGEQEMVPASWYYAEAAKVAELTAVLLKAEAHIVRLEKANTVRRRRVKYLVGKKNRLIEQQGAEILHLKAIGGGEVTPDAE